MRRWLEVAVPALQVVSERPPTWVVGALAWASTAGPVALLAAVVPLPTVSDLTYLGARTFIAGGWPWNVITLAGASIALVMLALLLLALADTALVARDRLDGRVVRAAYGLTLLGSAPVALPVIALALALAAVAPAEFTAPDSQGIGPVLRTAGAVSPLLAALAAITLTCAAWAARARVLVVHGASVASTAAGALRGATSGASIAHAVVGAVLWTGYLGVAVLLLGVLWDPIGERLAAGAGFGAAEGALLVGFVAIWLCLVLGGGALHAWGVVSWTRILAMREAPAGRGRPHPEETPSI